MSFFGSDIVQQEMKEIGELQDKIYGSVFKFPTMNKEDKLEHVQLLEDLLNKQRVLYTRLTLSQDPDATKMKDSIMESAQALGFPDDVDLAYVFANMCNILENMRTSIQESV